LFFSLETVRGIPESEIVQYRTHYWAIDQEKCDGCGECVEICPDCFEIVNDKAQFKCGECGPVAGECSPTCGLFGTDDAFFEAIASCPRNCIENVDDCEPDPEK